MRVDAGESVIRLEMTRVDNGSLRTKDLLEIRSAAVAGAVAYLQITEPDVEGRRWK